MRDQKMTGAELIAFLNKNFKTVEALLDTPLGRNLLQYLENEEKLIQGLKILYIFLPLPFRLAVRKEAFVKFCLAQKNKLLLRRGAGKTGDGDFTPEAEQGETATPVR